MTDQTPNDAFHASSFLQGANADYVEQLYARFAADPGSVDAETKIEAMRHAGIVVADSPAGLGEAVTKTIKG